MKKLFIITNALWLAVACYALHLKGGLPWIERKIETHLHPSAPRGDNQDTRQSVYDQLPIGTNDIVFLGDSILAAGEWAELMNDPRCKNRAIAGATTADVLRHLDPIIAGHPSDVVLMVGINDLQKSGAFGWDEQQAYSKLVRSLESMSPRTRIFLLDVLPVNESLYRKWITPDHQVVMPRRDYVNAWNYHGELGVGSGREGVLFVSLRFMLCNGELHSDYTYDGLHLNGVGLVEVAEALKMAMGTVTAVNKGFEDVAFAGSDHSVKGSTLPIVLPITNPGTNVTPVNTRFADSVRSVHSVNVTIDFLMGLPIQVQYYHRGPWVDVKGEPEWDWWHDDYRVRP